MLNRNPFSVHFQIDRKHYQELTFALKAHSVRKLEVRSEKVGVLALKTAEIQ